MRNFFAIQALFWKKLGPIKSHISQTSQNLLMKIQWNVNCLGPTKPHTKRTPSPLPAFSILVEGEKVEKKISFTLPWLVSSTISCGSLWVEKSQVFGTLLSSEIRLSLNSDVSMLEGNNTDTTLMNFIHVTTAFSLIISFGRKKNHFGEKTVTDGIDLLSVSIHFIRTFFSKFEVVQFRFLTKWHRSIFKYRFTKPDDWNSILCGMIWKGVSDSSNSL